METKVCRVCERELPLSEFKLSPAGAHVSVCRECVASKHRQTRAANRQNAMGGGNLPPFPDADFDGKQPVEVIQLMSRAKRWLESRGYEITLKGQYKEVKIKEVKF